MSDSSKKASIDFAEAVAVAGLCSCAATNKLLLEKGVITNDEYAKSLDFFAQKMLSNVYSESDATGFQIAINLLKVFANE